MKYDVSPLIPASAGMVLFLLGFWLRHSGGRPMLFGSMVLDGMGCVALLLGLAYAVSPERGLMLVRALMAAVLVVVLAMGALLGWVIVNNNTRISGQPQTLVVLGANLWNHEPSPILMERLEVAADYLNQHPETNVVVTGGMGDDEPVSEASCMARVLEERGVDGSRILLEEAATNTYENLKLTRALLEQRGLSTDNLLVVSSSAHLARVRLLAGRNELNVSTLSAPLPGGRLYQTYFYLREGAALVKSFLMDRG